MIKNKTAALVFRSASLIFVAAGIFANLRLAVGSAHPFSMLMFYTIQSNLLALALFALLTVRTAKELRAPGGCSFYPRLSMVVAVDLLVTLVGFWALLAPMAFTMADTGFQMWSFANLAAHLFTSLLCLADYLLFAQPGKLKYRNIYSAVIYPLAYVGFVTAAGFGGYTYAMPTEDGGAMHFPYFFLDWERLGAKVLLFVGVLVAFFVLLGHGLFWLDKARAKRAAHKS
jgi:hypothetical protein